MGAEAGPHAGGSATASAASAPLPWLGPPKPASRAVSITEAACCKRQATERTRQAALQNVLAQ